MQLNILLDFFFNIISSHISEGDGVMKHLSSAASCRNIGSAAS
jgi:hypothetical protein